MQHTRCTRADTRATSARRNGLKRTRGVRDCVRAYGHRVEIAAADSKLSGASGCNETALSERGNFEDERLHPKETQPRDFFIGNRPSTLSRTFVQCLEEKNMPLEWQSAVAASEATVSNTFFKHLKYGV